MERRRALAMLWAQERPADREMCLPIIGLGASALYAQNGAVTHGNDHHGLEIRLRCVGGVYYSSTVFECIGDLHGST